MARDLHLKPEARDARVRGRLGRALRRGVAAASLTTTLLSAGPASADANVFGDAGVLLGYAWGEGGGFTFGIEGRLGSVFGDEWDLECGGLAPAGAGVVRLESTGAFERTRLGVALQSGGVAGPMSAMVDLGFGYRWGEAGGLSVPIGFDLQVWATDTFVRFDPALEGGSVGGGFHYPMPDRQFGCVMVGRALHDEEGHAALPAVRALTPVATCTALESAIVHGWAERARAEWASVPAFLQLADQLGRAGAPPALALRALNAAQDELRHAVLSARVAVLATGVPMALGRVTPASRAPADGLTGLVRLAVESWLDGCLGEGIAAATAVQEARAAGPAALRKVQSIIARDEARHAALAWDVLAWAIARGGDDVRHAVAPLVEAALPGSDAPEDGPDLSAFGLLPAARRSSIGDACARSAQDRLRDLLA